MVKAEFSTTAMNRPNLLETTYESFCNKIKDVDYKNSTLYLNVDPVPEGDPMRVVKVAKKYFGNVIYRIPEEANFTAAVKWCWSQVKGDHVFHLEDDWILRRNISFLGVIDCINKEYEGKRVIQAYLRRTNSEHYKKVCLSPSLLDGNFVRERAKGFDINLNPEVQLRGSLGGVSVNFTLDVVLCDIGRAWIRASEYARPKKKRNFTKWIKK